MIGIILSLGTAFFTSLKEALAKKGLRRNIDKYIVACAFVLFSLPFLHTLWLVVDLPALDIEFGLILLIKTSLHVLALILITSALKASDLSLVSPMMAFTPVFMLITSPLMIDQFPHFLGLIGVMVIVAGAYILNIDQKKSGYLTPLIALGKENGPRYMLIAAFIYSLTSNIDKIGIDKLSSLAGAVEKDSAWLWVISEYTASSIVLLVIVLLRLLKNTNDLRILATNWKSLLPVLFGIGAFSCFAQLCHMTAIISDFPVIYVIAIKRAGIVLSVLWGYLFFREKKFRERLTGSICMAIGVFLIYLSL